MTKRGTLRFYALLSTLIIVMMLGACSSTPETEPSSGQPEGVASPETGDAELAPAPEDGPDPQVEPPPEEPAEPGEVEVSEELYVQTFDEVEATIEELNQIIANRNFVLWQDYLTPGYRQTYSNPEVLERSSESAILQRNNIELTSLQDYFNFVVVPSRANARLDDLVFRDEDTVEAIMEVDGQRYLLYLLKKMNNRWKIDTF
jgi:hypothetical protein